MSRQHVQPAGHSPFVARAQARTVRTVTGFVHERSGAHLRSDGRNVQWRDEREDYDSYYAALSGESRTARDALETGRESLAIA